MEEAVSRQSPQPPTICLMTGSNRSRSASFVSLYSARATEDRQASRAILACWTFLPVRSFSLILRLLGVVWMDEHDFDRFGFRDIRIDVRINFAPGVILWPAPREKSQGQPCALERQALRVGFGDPPPQFRRRAEWFASLARSTLSDTNPILTVETGETLCIRLPMSSTITQARFA